MPKFKEKEPSIFEQQTTVVDRYLYSLLQMSHSQLPGQSAQLRGLACKIKLDFGLIVAYILKWP